MAKDNKVLLHYGCQRSHDTYETYHAFELTDPDENIDEDAMAQRLAGLLDTRPDNDDFCYRNMYVALPSSMSREYPELEKYHVEGGIGRYYDHSQPQDKSAGEYGVIFEVDGTKYYFYCEAHTKNIALALFFKANPHISYSMVTEVVEVF